MYVEKTEEHRMPLPQRATQYSAGIDLQAHLHLPVVIKPGERVLVPTGYRWAVGGGNVGLVCPRSGLALKHGITVLNAPGVIDADYRGEVKVILWNTSNVNYTIHHGDRIAQLVVVDYIGFDPMLSPQPLHETERGESGFGSSGC